MTASCLATSSATEVDVARRSHVNLELCRASLQLHKFTPCSFEPRLQC